MRTKSILLALVFLSTLASAKDLKAYQDGKLLQMDSVQCGVQQKDAKKGDSRDVLCQEYVLQTEQVVYRIRSADEKHPILLPIGESAQFRLEKLKMHLRVPSMDGKEREFTVVSIKPRGENSAAASPSHLNHLQ
jgi:hypothetical protein